MAKPITTCAFLKWINANLLLGMVSNKMAIATIFGHNQSKNFIPLVWLNLYNCECWSNTVSSSKIAVKRQLTSKIIDKLQNGSCDQKIFLIKYDKDYII